MASYERACHLSPGIGTLPLVIKSMASSVEENVQMEYREEPFEILNEMESKMAAHLKKYVRLAGRCITSDLEELLARRHRDPTQPSWNSPGATTSSSARRPSLLELAERGDSERILHLLAEDHYNNVDINCRTENGDSPLHLAATGGHYKALVALLGAGAKVDCFSRLHRTPLHCAAARGHLRVVQRLLDAGACINTKDSNGNTALYLATGEVRTDVMVLLMRKRARANKRSLFLAVSTGSAASLELYLQREAPVNECNAEGDTLLIQAAKAGNCEMLELLLGYGASATKVNKRSESALVFAARNGSADAVRLLLYEGAASDSEQVEEGLRNAENAAVVQAFLDVLPEYVLGDMGMRCMLDAAEEGRLEALTALLDAGVNVNGEDESSVDFALTKAARNGHTACVKELLRRDVHVNARDANGSTALHLASSEGNLECVRVLLEHEASTSITDDWDRTPLHRACLFGSVECVRLLLDAGANTSEEDNEGNTPLHISSSVGDVESVRVLLDFGASRIAMNHNKETPLSVAASVEVRQAFNKRKRMS